jgi:2-polyprenyl-6-methoxyphenol hydroxylase-like FAD-dependent oxidoreductase
MGMGDMTDSTDTGVVIAGGGPTGLMLAYELALNGVTPIVVDSSPGPNTEPRANGVGGPAVRFLDHRGLYEKITGTPDGPQPSPLGAFSAFRMDLTSVPASQNYMLPVQQPDLTRTLAGRAADRGVDLRWGHRLHGFTQDPHSVTVEVHGPNGPYDIHADYLIGADGGRSATRKLAGIDFVGLSSNDAVFRIGRGLTPPPEWVDPVTGSVDVPGYGRITPMTFLRAGTGLFMWAQLSGLSMVGTLELAPTPGDTRTESEHPGFGDPLTTDELEDSIGRVLGSRVPVQPAEPGHQPVLRRFAGINSRIAQQYRHGRILLVGDAAHVHSPVGGPGLNLCLQDAANLGWKLANVLHGRVDPSLLDTYPTERRLAAENVITHTRAQQALMRPGPEITALREVFGSLLGETPVIRQLADTVSGIAVRYPTEPADHPAVGYWVPDLTINTATHGVQRIAQLAHEGRPLLLDLTTHGLVAEALNDITAAVNVVTGTPLAPVALTAILVRPDGYVGWASSDDHPEIDTLHRRLEHWFGLSAATPHT